VLRARGGGILGSAAGRGRGEHRGLSRSMLAPRAACDE